MNAIDEYLLDKGAISKTIVVLLFFSAVMVLSSILWPNISHTIFGDYVESGSKDIQEVARSFRGIGYLKLPVYIFIRNSLVSALSAVLGVTIIIPFAIITVNAMIVGYVIYANVLSEAPLQASVHNISTVITAGLVPHGSIELPAIALSSSIALYVIDILRSHRVNLLGVIKRNLVLSITMLMYAAVIEAFITPLIVIITILAGSVL